MVLSLFSFWQKNTAVHHCLLPLSYFFDYYGRLYRKNGRRFKLPVPVICVGNCVMGGVGKTPITIDLAQRLKKEGYRPYILSRGYRGKHKTPLKINPDTHQAIDVGDEPLLLAKATDCYIGAKRQKTGMMAIQEGADILLLDDGYQNASLHYDYRLLVIDAHYRFGNGYVFPAGPLRENSQHCINRADAILSVGKTAETTEAFEKPIFRLSLEPLPPLPQPITGKWIAFAGIARPEKFFQTLKKAGYHLEKSLHFPNHHYFSDKEINMLKKLAEQHQARLITTEKDAVRLPADIKKITSQLKISVQWQDNPDKLLSGIFSKIKERK